MGGATDMSVRNKGCAVLRQESSPRSLQLLCHDLNLVLSRCSRNSRHIRFAETTLNIFQMFTKTMSPI